MSPVTNVLSNYFTFTNTMNTPRCRCTSDVRTYVHLKDLMKVQYSMYQIEHFPSSDFLVSCLRGPGCSHPTPSRARRTNAMVLKDDYVLEKKATWYGHKASFSVFPVPSFSSEAKWCGAHSSFLVAQHPRLTFFSPVSIRCALYPQGLGAAGKATEVRGCDQEQQSDTPSS